MLRLDLEMLHRADQDRNFTYREAFNAATDKFVLLADSTMRELDVAQDGRWAIGRDVRGYIYDYERPTADLYRVNTSTGERTLIAKKQLTGASGLDLQSLDPTKEIRSHIQEGMAEGEKAIAEGKGMFDNPLAEPESGLLTESVILPSAIASLIARPRSEESVATRSTARSNGSLSTTRRLSLPVGMTRA